MHPKAEQVIDRPAAQVFQFVATDHFSNHPKWDAAWVEMTPTSPGPLRAGTTTRVVRIERGQRLEGVAEGTTYEPDHAFAAVLRFGPFVLQQRLLLHPLTGRTTHLALTIDTKAAGALGLLLPLMRRQFRRSMAASLRTSRQLVEASDS